MQVTRVKIVVIGSHSVGKTSLLNAIVAGHNAVNSDDYRPFDNVSTMTVKVDRGEKQYQMELWDTKSVDFYKILDEMQQTDVFGVVLVCYSVMDLKTFQDVKKKWLPTARKSAPNSHVMIVGTKIDLRDDKVSLLRLDRLQNLKPITVEEGYVFAKSHGAHFHECSSLSSIGIDDIFNKIIAVPRDPPDRDNVCSCIIL